MVLNINRDSMAQVGFSPPTRIFEAAGAGACLITDDWTGVEDFFAPGREILVAESAEQIVRYLRTVTNAQAREIGENMRSRALREHTYALRAGEFEAAVKKIHHRDTETLRKAVKQGTGYRGQVTGKPREVLDVGKGN
jgi:spore maturation protein CgeB